jgi:NAD(P)-dependent dehydrogenase (short-subunit alcohol dehydrogenase family)
MPKTILITGCSSGIGKKTAEAFLALGWNVVATMRNTQESDLEGKNLLVLPLDVTDSRSVEQAVVAATEKFGKIDVLVNNAGFGLFGPFEYEKEDDIRRQFETNVFGLMAVTWQVLPVFQTAGGGMIVNVSSILGQMGVPFYSVYASSKWAVEGFSEAIAYELAPMNIQVKLIEPGPVRTQFYAQKGFQEQRDLGVYQAYFERVRGDAHKRESSGASPEDVAQVIVRAVQGSKDKMRYPAGSTATLLLFLRKVTPIDLFRKIMKASVR